MTAIQTLFKIACVVMLRRWKLPQGFISQINAPL